MQESALDWKTKCREVTQDTHRGTDKRHSTDIDPNHDTLTSLITTTHDLPRTQEARTKQRATIFIFSKTFLKLKALLQRHTYHVDESRELPKRPNYKGGMLLPMFLAS